MTKVSVFGSAGVQDAKEVKYRSYWGPACGCSMDLPFRPWCQIVESDVRGWVVVE